MFLHTHCMESSVDTKKAVELRKQGLTLREIGNIFGVSKQRVAQLIGKTNHFKQLYKLRNKPIKPKKERIYLTKVCNICNTEKRKIYFVTSVNYPDGRRPFCKECKDNLKRAKRGLPPKKWIYKVKKTPVKKVIELTDEGVDILIKNGYARNREEAKRYLQC